MKATHIWGRDWAARAKDAEFALLPMGSFEYHGPMAPVGTDAVIVTALAEWAAEALPCLVYPPILYTACPQKTCRQPTISIAPDTMAAYLLQVMRGIQSGGTNRLLILNAHDGNMGIARAAAEAMGGGFQTLIVNWWQLLTEAETQEIFTDGGRGHGGPYELSAAWAAMGDTSARGEALYDRAAHKFPAPHVLVEAAPNGFDGYAGRISEASGEAGAMVLDRAKAALLRVVAAWREAPFTT